MSEDQPVDQNNEEIKKIIADQVSEVIKDVVENGSVVGYDPMQTWKKGRNSFIKSIISIIVLIALTKLAAYTGIVLTAETQSGIIIGGIAIFNAGLTASHNWFKHKDT